MKRINRKLRRAQALERDRVYAWLMTLLANRRWTELVLALRSQQGAQVHDLRNRLASLDVEITQTRAAHARLKG